MQPVHHAPSVPAECYDLFALPETQPTRSLDDPRIELVGRGRRQRLDASFPDPVTLFGDVVRNEQHDALVIWPGPQRHSTLIGLAALELAKEPIDCPELGDAWQGFTVAFQAPLIEQTV